MSKAHDDIRQQIAKLQNLRDNEDDQDFRKALEIKIDRLCAQLTSAQRHPPPSTNVHMSGGTTHGPVTGVNYGVVQAFFGIQDTTHLVSYADLLANYLDTLVQQYSRLRLGKLLAKDQTGREEATAPALSLLKVYTSLATDCWLPLKNGRFANKTPKALLKQMDKHNPSQVMPEQLHIPLLHESGHALSKSVKGITWDSVQRDLAQRPSGESLTGHWCCAEPAHHTLTTHSRLVLLGAPGSGKSTVLRYLTVWLAQQLLANTEKKLPVPLFCQLGQVAKQFTNDQTRDLPYLIEALLSPVEGIGNLRKDLRPHMLAAWRTGGALLFLDGLDEVSSIPTENTAGKTSHRERMADAIRRLAEQLGTSRIVVTCRAKPYEQDAAWQLRDPWVVRTLQPFIFGQVRHFIPAWYQQACANPHTKFTPNEAQERAERLIDILEQRELLHDLTGSPLLLTMLALLDYNSKQLPEKQVDVYEELVGLLLDRWAEVRSADKPQQMIALGDRLALPTLTVNDLRPVIYDIAFDAHATAVDGCGILSEDVVNTKLDTFFERKLDANIPRHRRRPECAWRSAEVLHLLSEETGLVQDDGNGQYVLPHLTFEEYLAACHLEYRDDVQHIYACWYESPDRWRDVLLLLMGRLVRHNKFSLMFHWLDNLVCERCGTVSKSPSQRQRDAIFAAVCYEEVGRRTYLVDRTHVDVIGLEQRMTNALIEVLERPAIDIHTRQRIEAGFLLGDLGDPRVPVTLAQWRATLPKDEGGRMKDESEPGASLSDSSFIPHPSALQSYWCYVPAGTYIIGNCDDASYARNHAKPEHTITILQPFYIARYPITNAQWQTWVDEANGQPSYLSDDSNLNRPNQPVVSITWNSCNDFCLWLSEQLGYEVRLPMEAEWEVAACGSDACCYPWGDDWCDDHAATHEDKETRGWQWSVPVGCYPAGVAPCGALDMAGNVWEWTTDVWRSYPGAAEPLEEEYRHVLKGGDGYHADRKLVCCAARGWPPLPAYTFGFRLLLRFTRHTR